MSEKELIRACLVQRRRSDLADLEQVSGGGTRVVNPGVLIDILMGEGHEQE